MKAKHFYLISEQIRTNAHKAIDDALLDGKTKVTISAAGSKSAKQRGLQHIWYDDVVKSGIGGIEEETHNGVDAKAKKNFAMDIIARNPEKYEDFIYLWEQAATIRPFDEKFTNYFYHNHCHTEWFDTSEMAEFLTAFQIYYTNHGVNLSDPMDKKLLEWKR